MSCPKDEIITLTCYTVWLSEEQLDVAIRNSGGRVPKGFNLSDAYVDIPEKGCLRLKFKKQEYDMYGGKK